MTIKNMSYHSTDIKEEATWVHRKRGKCRSCGGDQLSLFLSLGETPLANSFLETPDEFEKELSFPLEVYFCQNCSLVQLLDVINPEILFRDYIYVTGTSDTIADHNLEYAQTVVDQLYLNSGDLVIEVASNDGSLLKCFKRLGVKTLGIEPALNIAEIAKSSGIETITEFFNFETAQKVKESYGFAKAVIGNNVLAHVDDTGDFLRGCRELLDEQGLIIIEVPYLGELIKKLEYDTIYHEHLCYFSVNALIRLCETLELSIIRIDRVSVHGGSLRIYAGKNSYYKSHTEEVIDFAEEEKQDELISWQTMLDFSKEVKKNRVDLMGLLKGLKEEGKTAVGYGAPAKGNTLLNYCGIDNNILPYTVDKNPLKVGLFTPGTHIPVLPVPTLLEKQPDFVLILAWNFADEIMRQQAEYRNRGGKFIVPIPKPKVV